MLLFGISIAKMAAFVGRVSRQGLLQSKSSLQNSRVSFNLIIIRIYILHHAFLFPDNLFSTLSVITFLNNDL